MLVDRIIGAFTFRRGVYAEVEEDTTFTTTAWIIVAVAAFLNQVGSQATGDLVKWLLGAIGGTVFAVIAFAVAALIVNWVGRTVFKADVTFEELVRTLGLAHVWQVIGILGILLAVSGALACIMAPILLIAGIAMLIAWFVAAREALDLEWVQTIVTVILGWLAWLVVMAIARAVLGLLGWGAAAAGGFFGL